MSTTTYSPSINTPNVLLNNVSSSRDLVYQGGSAAPSTSNSAVVLQWVNKIVNTYTPTPFGSGVPLLNTTTLAYTPGFYYGAITVPDGRVIFTPGGSGNVGIYNPATNSFTTILVGAVGAGFPWLTGTLLQDGRIAWSPDGGVAGRGVGIFNPSTNTFTSTNGTVTGTDIYEWSALAPDGRVVFPCSTSPGNIGTYNPYTNSFITYASGQAGLASSPAPSYKSACTVADGRIVFGPYGGGNVGVFNPYTNSYISYAYNQAGTNTQYAMFAGSVLAPDGRVVFVPHNAEGPATFDPITNTFTSYPVLGAGGQKYHNGCLLPTGEILMTPWSLRNFGLFNPKTNTFRTILSLPVSPGTICPVVLPDGRIVISPSSERNAWVISGLCTAVPQDFIMHPFFNRCS